MIRTLIFDLDDTLLDTNRLLVPQAENESCRAMIRAGLDGDIETCANVRRQLIRENLREQIFEMIVKKIGVKEGADPTEVAKAGSKAFYEREVENSIYLEPEVLRLLEKLQSKYELFLVTAGAVKTQRQKVEILKIAKYFKHIIYVDLARGETKAQKFREVSELAACPNENILSIGDRIDTDVAGAKNLGMKTCWVVRGEYAKLKPLTLIEEPDFKVKQVTEIESVCHL